MQRYTQCCKRPTIVVETAFVLVMLKAMIVVSVVVVVVEVVAVAAAAAAAAAVVFLINHKTSLGKDGLMSTSSSY